MVQGERLGEDRRIPERARGFDLGLDAARGCRWHTSVPRRAAREGATGARLRRRTARRVPVPATPRCARDRSVTAARRARLRRARARRCPGSSHPRRRRRRVAARSNSSRADASRPQRSTRLRMRGQQRGRRPSEARGFVRFARGFQQFGRALRVRWPRRAPRLRPARSPLRDSRRRPRGGRPRARGGRGGTVGSTKARSARGEPRRAGGCRRCPSCPMVCSSVGADLLVRERHAVGKLHRRESELLELGRERQRVDALVDGDRADVAQARRSVEHRGVRGRERNLRRQCREPLIDQRADDTVGARSRCRRPGRTSSGSPPVAATTNAMSASETPSTPRVRQTSATSAGSRPWSAMPSSRRDRTLRVPVDG